MLPRNSCHPPPHGLRLEAGGSRLPLDVPTTLRTPSRRPKASRVDPLNRLGRGPRLPDWVARRMKAPDGAAVRPRVVRAVASLERLTRDRPGLDVVEHLQDEVGGDGL